MLQAPEAVSLRNVQIIVDISEDGDGRAVGTVKAVGQEVSRRFSGNLELLALIENLFRVHPDPASGDGPDEQEQA